MKCFIDHPTIRPLTSGNPSLQSRSQNVDVANRSPGASPSPSRCQTSVDTPESLGAVRARGRDSNASCPARAPPPFHQRNGNGRSKVLQGEKQAEAGKNGGHARGHTGRPTPLGFGLSLLPLCRKVKQPEEGRYPGLLQALAGCRLCFCLPKPAVYPVPQCSVA